MGNVFFYLGEEIEQGKLMLQKEEELNRNQ